MENAIKLLARLEDVDALLHSPLFQRYSTAPAIEHLIIATCFDTPLRKMGDESIQTFKADAGTNGGLHRWEEYETPVRGERPALSPLRKMTDRKSKLGALLHSAQMKDRLAPVFATRMKRTVCPLRLPQGDIVECAVDAGEIMGDATKMWRKFTPARLPQ